MKAAYLFPGQGAQFVGMTRELYDTRPEARALFEEASERLGYDAAKIAFAGPDELLNSTEYTQPLLLTACMAAHAAWTREHPEFRPEYMAGLSLGEYAALVAAGSLDFGDAVALTRLRGKLMQETVPQGVGGMAAVMGLDAAEVERLCAEIRTPEAWVEPANYNSPGQLVVSGHIPAVRALCKAAKEAGAKRALPLPVSAPFHSRLLIPAGERLAEALQEVEVRDARVPVISNVTAHPVTAAAAIRRVLVEQVSSPVRMEQSFRFMADAGTDLWVELGPGQSMAKLLARVIPDAVAVSVGDPESLAAAAEHAA
ncbi:MAG TPA: ACP S-malonyltransferase [Longimicrobium sp.]